MTPSSNRPAARLILGIDPGSIHTGYGLVEQSAGRLRAVEFGVLSAGGSSLPLPLRLDRLFTELEELMRRASPDVVAVESVFTHRNVRSALVLAHARAVVLLAVSRAGVGFEEHAPRAVKAAVTGFGAAEKPQVAGMVRRLLRLEDSSERADAWDALAVAVCEAHTAPMRDAVRVARTSPARAPSIR